MCTKVAVVTGSNKGIGLAVVKALCQQFAGEVYLTARDSGRGHAAMKELTNEGLHPLFHQLDITDPSSIATATKFFKEHYGGIDVLVNNAGIAYKRRVVNVSSGMGSMALSRCSPALQERFRSDDLSEEELVGLMQRFVDEAQKGGHREGGWPDTAYGVSKMGLTILLNACCPGWVRTDMAGPNATKSPQEGTVTPVYLAMLPSGATEPHGQFVSEMKAQPW